MLLNSASWSYKCNEIRVFQRKRWQLVARRCTSSEKETTPPMGKVTLGMLAKEVVEGGIWANIPARQTPWGVREVANMALGGVPLGLALTVLSFFNLPTEDVSWGLQPTTLKALSHLGQEIVLDVSILALLFVALGKTQPWSRGFFYFSLSRDWVLASLGIAVVAFPLVDPLLHYIVYSISGESVRLADGAYKSILEECIRAGDVIALLMHLTASCLFGPFWEEIFWRGFLLPSIISRLNPSQFQLGILVSSATFSALHLSAGAFSLILVISCLCDTVSLRSSSLGPPLLIHCLFNAYEFVGVLGGRDFI
jgi:membrane protease YdiL (CAAX protease family)